jgi:hypothetical protein
MKGIGDRPLQYFDLRSAMFLAISGCPSRYVVVSRDALCS